MWKAHNMAHFFFEFAFCMISHVWIVAIFLFVVYTSLRSTTFLNVQSITSKSVHLVICELQRRKKEKKKHFNAIDFVEHYRLMYLMWIFHWIFITAGVCIWVRKHSQWLSTSRELDSSTRTCYRWRRHKNKIKKFKKKKQYALEPMTVLNKIGK